MKPLLDPALDTESSESDQLVSLIGVAVLHHAPLLVEPRCLWLMHVEVLRGAYTEADVALKIARLVILALLAWPVLGEVLGRSRDKLELVCWRRHLSGVDGPVEVSVQSG